MNLGLENRVLKQVGVIFQEEEGKNKKRKFAVSEILAGSEIRFVFWV